MNYDYIFKDLGIQGTRKSGGDQNKIILEYEITTGETIQETNIITFSTNNKIQKCSSGEIPRGIALSGGIGGDKIKVQLSGGTVKLSGYFVPSFIYFNDASGNLTTTEPTELNDYTKRIGMALSSDELLLENGVFLSD